MLRSGPHRAAVAALALAAGATVASADILGLNGLFLQFQPTVDLTDADFAGVPNGFIRPNLSTAPDVATSDATILGFSTAAGTVTNLRGPIAALNVVTFPTGLEPPTGDVIRNVWGFQGPEVPGVDSILGLNAGAGLDNAGATGNPDNPIQAFDVLFADGVIGAAGIGNDFFLLDIIGDDAVMIQPLDASGQVIGDFSVTLQSGPGANNFGNEDLGDFGLTGLDMALFLENGANIGLAEETVIDDVPLAGVAWDVEDFVGTGTLDAIFGLRITPLDPDPSVSSGEGSIDLIAIGYNVDAVPAAPSAALIGLAGLAAARRRRA